MTEKEEEEAEARVRLADAVKEHLPSTFTSLSIAVLIWLFGVLVFLPAARRIEPIRVPLICSLIVLIGLSIFIFSAVGGLRRLLDTASGVIAYEYRRRRKEVKLSVEQLETAVRCIAYVVVTLIIYALYWPLLASIHPSLSGLAFIPIVLWILLAIFRTITTLTTRA